MTHSRRRQGFTVLEIATAFAVLAMIGVVIAQLATSLLSQRSAQENRELALAHAENVLEVAKSIDSKDLSEWAEIQALPENLRARWPQGKVSVTVEPLKEMSKLRRVTVTVTWAADSAAAIAPVTLSTWIAEGSP